MPQSENAVWRRRQGGEVGTRPEIGSLPPCQPLDLYPYVTGNIWGHGMSGHVLDMSIVQPEEPKSGKPLQRAQLRAHDDLDGWDGGKGWEEGTRGKS